MLRFNPSVVLYCKTFVPISIHPMLRFNLLKGYVKSCGCSISIHPMLRFNRAPPFRVRVYVRISIHPMLRFNTKNFPRTFN